jgi:hypothetical protein
MTEEPRKRNKDIYFTAKVLPHETGLLMGDPVD